MQPFLRSDATTTEKTSLLLQKVAKVTNQLVQGKKYLESFYLISRIKYLCHKWTHIPSSSVIRSRVISLSSLNIPAVMPLTKSRTNQSTLRSKNSALNLRTLKPRRFSPHGHCRNSGRSGTAEAGCSGRCGSEHSEPSRRSLSCSVSLQGSALAAPSTARGGQEGPRPGTPVSSGAEAAGPAGRGSSPWQPQGRGSRWRRCFHPRPCESPRLGCPGSICPTPTPKREEGTGA